MRIVVGEGKRWDERNVDRWIWVGSPRFQMENWMEEFKGDWVPAASSVAVMHGSEFRGEKNAALIERSMATICDMRCYHLELSEKRGYGTTNGSTNEVWKEPQL